MRRRTLLGLLGLPAAGGLGALLGACGEDEPVSEPDGPRRPTGEGRSDYGRDPSQYGELTLPSGTPRGVVVVIHGGFWKAAYDASLGRPLAAALAAQGWAAWNLEYRRVGHGGGAPATFDDVSAGIDHLAGLGLDLTTVVTLGHSAGGHLATWAATRGRDGRWPDRVPVTAVVSQAGVLDLGAADADGLGDGAVRALLGHAPAAADAPYDPVRMVPAGVPVWCVHGRDDDVVPPSQSAAYVEAARAAGGHAELVEVDGDHFTVIDTESEAWTRILAILDSLG